MTRQPVVPPLPRMEAEEEEVVVELVVVSTAEDKAVMTL